jgi:hypothetical protein
VPKFRQMAQEVGRDPNSLEVTSFGLGEDLDRVKRLAEMGVVRVVPIFSAGEGGYGDAHRRPVGQNHAAGERIGTAAAAT